MAARATPKTERRHIALLTFVPVIVALLIMWGALVAFARLERTSALDHVRTQLFSTVATLADFNELAERSGSKNASQINAKRTAAVWNALLQFPSADFWIISNGHVVAGQTPRGDARSIVAEDARETFSAKASLPEFDALKDWRRGTLLSVIVLAALTLGCLVLSRFLDRALRQRAAAERETAANAERTTQLAFYRTQLEETVARRTEELAEANSHLETELVERRAVQVTLRERDALLNAVTKSAGELLGSQSFDVSIATVLALIGTTLGVDRVQAASIAADTAGRYKSTLRSEWCAPGVTSSLGTSASTDVDLGSKFPALVERLIAGTLASFNVAELPLPHRAGYERAGARSVLFIPIFAEGVLQGSLNFVDSSSPARHWSQAESDTLKTLAGLIAGARMRDRYIAELADAKTIVENSPTILFRVSGEAPFALLYVSSNIAKFGHDADALERSVDWAARLIGARDRAALSAAMGDMLQRRSEGDTLEFHLLTGPGEERWVESRYTARRDAAGKLIEVEGIVIDIEERKVAEEKIELLARTDSLTGLANRATFLERLHQTFAAAQRGAQPFAIMYLDLDGFKSVNDTLGHAAGDRLLQEVAARLVGCVRDTDLVARLGGDEFAVLQSQLDEPASAGVLAAKIRAKLDVPYPLGAGGVHSTVSIGICPYTTASAAPDQMLAQADLALYRSKEEGRNQYRFYSADLDRELLGHVAFAEELRDAVEGGELEFYCEPQVELTTGMSVDMKAMVRWHHPTRGPLAAGDFLRTLEKTPTGAAFGYWLIDMACREFARLRAAGSAPSAVSVDVRFWQLKHGDELLGVVAASLARWGLSAADLELDVTEETLAKATLARSATLGRLRALGVGIAIADFGTGYSSFEYIHSYKVKRVKLSPSLIASSFVIPESAATIHAIVELAREIDIEVIAEGLTTQEQRATIFSPTGAMPVENDG